MHPKIAVEKIAKKRTVEQIANEFKATLI